MGFWFYLEIRKSFNFLDKNGDGSISPQELREAFTHLGHSPDALFLTTVFKQADEDGKTFLVQIPA